MRTGVAGVRSNRIAGLGNNSSLFKARHRGLRVGYVPLGGVAPIQDLCWAPLNHPRHILTSDS